MTPTTYDALAASLSEAEREELAERAGILEYMAGLPRSVAEERAAAMWVRAKGVGDEG